MKTASKAKPKQALLRRVPIESLKTARFNPKSRSEAINKLASSLESDGQLYPILVTDKLEVVDGHRRLAAAKSLPGTKWMS